MIKFLRSFFRKIYKIEEDLDKIIQAIGRIELKQLVINKKPINSPENEFKVYSQSGEDGIIQSIVRKLNLNREIFVEFGVENYLESNTRFLLLNDYWSGLVIDGSESNINFIKNDPIYWRCNLKASCNFIDASNINDILESNGVFGEIGLLSVDIDGNDYWVFKSIKNINPKIIVMEYNSFFGSERSVTIPYHKDFIRDKAHYSKNLLRCFNKCFNFFSKF